jgi:hypothetical protein
MMMNLIADFDSPVRLVGYRSVCCLLLLQHFITAYLNKIYAQNINIKVRKNKGYLEALYIHKYLFYLSYAHYRNTSYSLFWFMTI